jgi:hypothetical protein
MSNEPQQTPDISAEATSRAEVATPRASRYLQQLAKHFQHKVPASFDAQAATVEFPVGTCRMAADAERLTLVASAPDAESLTQLQEVIASHLVRFAFREELEVTWR